MRRRRIPVWRRTDAASLLPQNTDWLRTRRALERRQRRSPPQRRPPPRPPEPRDATAAPGGFDSDPRALCALYPGVRACPTWKAPID